MTNEEALNITQDLLDRQGAATMAGDVDTTVDFCNLPCTLESLQGRAVATNVAELRAICSAFIAEIRSRQLTHMARRCLEAVAKSESEIWATYETRYVRERQLLTEDPYLSFVILRRPDRRWKISAVQFAVEADSPANTTLKDWAAHRIVVPGEPADRPVATIDSHYAMFEKLAE